MAGLVLRSGVTMDTHLVVDASGRHSRLPQWLSDEGFEVPPAETVNSKLGYATRMYHIPEWNKVRYLHVLHLFLKCNCVQNKTNMICCMRADHCDCAEPLLSPEGDTHMCCLCQQDYKMAVNFSSDSGTRNGMIWPVEGDHVYMVALSGYLGDHPPTTEAAFLEFAASLEVGQTVVNVVLKQSWPSMLLCTTRRVTYNSIKLVRALLELCCAEVVRLIC